MANGFPDPGHGYVVREYLGGGNWKSAFRASTPYKLADVALLFFNEGTPADVVTEDVNHLLRTAREHRYSSYLAQVHGVHFYDKGKVFIVEELLERPLERIAPLRELPKFVRISRDLSRGVFCLHELGLVHRDLKLDNCGLDARQAAKVFDLGSVTSEGGEVFGTILTRAPELFSGECDRYDKLCDVWALGATLFALRSATYPFCFPGEVVQRRSINEELRRGSIDKTTAEERKRIIDERVANRILASGAEESLCDRLRAEVGGRPLEVLMGMLRFERSRRISVADAEREWTSIAGQLSGVKEGVDQNLSRWEKIIFHLGAVERGELRLTKKQVRGIMTEYETEKPDDTDGRIGAALRRVKELVEQ